MRKDVQAKTGRFGLVTMVLCAAVLASSIGAEIVGRTRRRHGPLPNLSYIVPSDPGGWRVQDLPIGPTEGISQATIQELRFDSFIYREYQKEGAAFSVYLAY